jgi:hypothetical protein
MNNIKNEKESSRILLEALVIIWLTTGYPLRQFFPEEIGLLISAIGLLICLTISFLIVLSDNKLQDLLLFKKKLFIYTFIWVLYLTWGTFSSFLSSHGSLRYQLMLISGILTALFVVKFGSVSILTIYRIAFWITFPFTLLWFYNFISHGLVLGITHRDPSYGIISIVPLCYTAFMHRFPINLLIEILILTSLLFNGQRISFFAGILIIFIQIIYFLRHRLNKMSFAIRLMHISLFILIIVAIKTHYKYLLSFILNGILLLNNPFRGISSGFSNRYLGWSESLQLFYERPVLGWGSKANEVLLQDSSYVIISSSHNGILANLVDYGFPGAMMSIAIMLLPIYISMCRAWTYLEKEYLLMSSLGVGYIVMGMGERYWFNIGNPTSILILFTLFYIISDEK